MRGEKWLVAAGGGVALQLALSTIYEVFLGGHDPAVYEKLVDEPVSELVKGTIKGPIIEEVIFRGVPLVLFPSAQTFGPVGFISSAVFAAAHDSMSADIFVKGLFYWHIARTRGLAPAMVAHSATNLTYYGVVTALYA